MVNNIKDLLKKKENIYGLFVHLTDPSIIEIAYHAGFDFVRIGLEHMLFDYSLIISIIRTADNYDMPVFFKIRDLDDIPAILDAGASGIVVPHVTSEKKISKAVKLTKFSPIGERSVFEHSRRLGYGEKPITDYMKNANNIVSLVVQIEDKNGLNNLDKILSVDGVDMVTTGRSDLSQSLGFPGQSEHEEVLKIEEKVIKTALKHGKCPVVSANTTERIFKLHNLGVKCIWVGPDTKFLLNSFKKFLHQI